MAKREQMTKVEVFEKTEVDAGEKQNPIAEMLSDDNAELTATGETEIGNTIDDKVEGDVIEPIAFEIKLKSLHPCESYGRCGYRFNKVSALEIAREDLTDEQIIILSQDPYLELVPVTEGEE